MDDLVRWEHSPVIDEEGSEQMGVYTFYQDREKSSIRNGRESKLKKKKSQTSLSKKLKLDKSLRYSSKKKHSQKQNKKLKTEQKPPTNRLQSKKFLKDIFDKKHQRSLSKMKEKHSVQEKNQIKQRIKVKIRSINRSIEPYPIQRFDLLQRCRTSFDSSNSFTKKESKNMKRMHTEVLINFSNLSIDPKPSDQPIKSPKVVNLNEQNNKIMGPELIYEQKLKQKQMRLPYFPEIKKSEIQKCFKLIEQKKQQERVEIASMHPRSKSTLKSCKKISKSTAITKNAELEQIHRLKIIELGKNAQDYLQHDWPEDKKTFLRKMGFKC